METTRSGGGGKRSARSAEREPEPRPKTPEAGCGGRRARANSARARGGSNFRVLGLFKGLRVGKFPSPSAEPPSWPTTISRAGSALRLERGERRPRVAPE